MKKPIKITIIGILLLIPLYLLVAFLTRDLGRGWCELSFGGYSDIIRCSGYDKNSGPTNCKYGPDKICSRGLFNSRGGARNYEGPGPMGIN